MDLGMVGRFIRFIEAHEETITAIAWKWMVAGVVILVSKRLERMFIRLVRENGVAVAFAVESANVVVQEDEDEDEDGEVEMESKEALENELRVIWDEVEFWETLMCMI